MSARLFAALSLLLLSAVAAHATQPSLSDAKAQKAAVKCQTAIDQAGAKLFATELKSLDACSTAVLGCIQVKPTDPACLAKSTAKCAKALRDAIPQAQVGATAKIVKSCGTPLRAADLLATDGLGIGARASACSTDFDLDVCSDLATLAQCVVAEQARAAERVFATELPRARELMTHVLSPLPLDDLPAFPGCDTCAETPSETIGKAVTACGAATSKAGRTFAAAVGKALGGCIDKVFACIQTKPGDAKCLGKAASACDGSVAKLAVARGKLAAGVDKKCGAASALPFATVAGPSGLNLAALADDCEVLGVATLASIDDYVACTRRQHECEVAATLRSTLPRTAELVDANVLGGAGALLDAAECPESLPSHLLTSVARARAARFVGTFSITRFFGGMKKIVGNSGVAATKVAGTAPASSPSGVRRVSFSQGTPNRFLPGSSKIVKVSYGGAGKSARSMRAAADVVAPTMIVTVKRGDIVVDDHFEIPLDPLAGDEDGEVDLELDYSDTPPSCVFDLAIAVSDADGVSEYTSAEQVADTVPPPTATPVATTTAVPTPTATPGNPTATATPATAVVYELTSTDDRVAPGGVATFVLTVTNLTNAPQNATATFTVPPFTFYGAYPGGAVRPVSFSGIAAGASQSALVNLTVTNGGAAPPDDTPIAVTFNDAAHGASASHTITTDATPPAELTLSTAAATVAPGEHFTYVLDYLNPQSEPLTDAELTVAIPAGAAFVATEGSVVLDPGGIVRWSLGSLPGHSTGQRTVTFVADASAHAALVVDATLRGGGQVLTTASATTAVDANPTFAYTLTTIDDPVAPGGDATFRLTATNLTNAVQNATVYLRVPDFTFYGAYPAGSLRPISFANVAAGASQSALIALTVNNGATAPPDGTLLTLAVTDTLRASRLTRTIVARSAPAATLDLTTQQASVAPGGPFAYTLLFHNAGNAPLVGGEASVAVPAGATFAAADDGVVPDADGVVRWPLGTLAANASGQRTVTFTAGASTEGALLVEAKVRAADAAVLAQASAATVVDATSVFSYTLTTTDDLVVPSDYAVFVLTATNRTNALQNATLYLRVPDSTFYGAYPAGSLRPVSFSNVAAGASQSALIAIAVNGGASAPPDGSTITLVVDDTARGAAVSRAVVVDATAAAELTLTTAQSSVAPGAAFAYTAVVSYAGGTPLAGADLYVAVPDGASFVSATDGGTLEADGVVRWAVDSGGRERSVTFLADANASAALRVEAALRDTDGEIVTRASAATSVAAAPTFAYTLTSTDDDPVKPGGTVTYLLTATNLTNAVQNATLYLRVPDFTFYGAYPAGSLRPVSFSNVAAGASQSALVALNVTSGAAAPPDGTVITLALYDTARAATVSHAVVAESAGRAQLKISTADAAVAPGGVFAYTLHFHAAQANDLTNVALAVPVPPGATFESANGGGALGADGVVRWALGTLVAGSSGSVAVTLKASASAEAPLRVAGTLSDGSARVLATASATMTVDATPAFSYTLTTGNDPVSPGQTASFLLTVKNLGNTTQTATLSFRVPDFTSYGAYLAGAVRSVSFTNLVAGASQETVISLLVGSGGGGPPTGTLIDLTTTDGARAASVSRTIVVGNPP